MTKILVVEDDRSLSDGLVYNLRREGHTPVLAEDAPGAVRVAREEKPDLVVLDLMLPGGSGFDVCRAIRAFSTVPIIMLTARDEDVDRVLGLELGADDYVTKPFGLRELLARIHANLRRVEYDQQPKQQNAVQLGDLAIDIEQRRVWMGDKPIALQPKEFDLLAYFVQHPGKVLTRAQLLHQVWGHEFVGERTVDVHVRRVRAKLEGSIAIDALRTVHGVGYAFDAGSEVGSHT